MIFQFVENVPHKWIIIVKDVFFCGGRQIGQSLKFIKNGEMAQA